MHTAHLTKKNFYNKVTPLQNKGKKLTKENQVLDNLNLFDDLPNPVGRPKQFGSNAEKQKAYRARLKAKGKRVITRTVTDTRNDSILKSDIIDLSEVKQ